MKPKGVTSSHTKGETAPIVVTVVGGYLGAGKTTLVNHVLRSSHERIAVIVNDFGEISIDEELIVAADSDKLTLANGCICCSLADGFATALLQVRASEPRPTRLLIEASGVSDPAQIAAYGHTPGLRLDAVVVLADAETVRARADDRWVADTVRRQIGAADLLILNKVDLLNTQLADDDLCDWLRVLAPNAALVRATDAEVPLDVLFDAPAGSQGDRAGTTGTDMISTGTTGTARVSAADVFESCTISLDKPIPIERMEALLADLPESVLRLKGLVQLSHPVQLSSAGSAGSDRSVEVSAGSDRNVGDSVGVSVGDYVVQAVGKRASVTPSGPHARHVLSLVARRNTAALDWLESQLQHSL